MNILVHVHGCTPYGNQIMVSLHVCTTEGHELGGDMVMDFAASSTQMNTRIADRARQLLRDTFGLTIANNAPVKIMGGVV